jgi:methionyl-tRNA formyltransferase
MRIVFVGTGDIGLPTLRALLQSPGDDVAGIVTQPDKPAGRDRRVQAPPIKLEVAATAVPLFQPARIRSEEAIAQIRRLAPELIVVMAYGQILPGSLLEIPKLGCLNLHASLLPRHRGAAPIQAAILAGDRETGITVMYMDEGLDTGDVFLQKKVAISPNESGGSLHDRLAQLAPEALFEALELLKTGKATRVRQDSAEATYAPRLTREDGRIDWTLGADVIERKTRAYDPWPGAFTEVEDASGRSRNLKIFRATALETKVGAPATVSLPNDRELLVATGNGSLRLEEVQLEGKRRMNATEFLRGFFSPRIHF